MDLTWNEPLRDLQTARSHLAKDDLGAPLVLPWRLYDQLTQMLGREATVEDIPAGAPGIWTSVIRSEP